MKLSYCFIILLWFPFGVFSYQEVLENNISTHEVIARLIIDREPHRNTMPICYNYGCKTKNTIQINNNTIQSLQLIFSKNSNAENERLDIANAIAFLETITAKQTPTYNDRGKNYNDNYPGKMDCIDEAANTTHYLHLIEELDLLKWHKVQPPVYRSPWLMGQHWSAQIKDLTTKQYFAVDSWHKDNGLPPVIQAIENWKTRDSRYQEPVRE